MARALSGRKIVQAKLRAHNLKSGGLHGVVGPTWVHTFGVSGPKSSVSSSCYQGVFSRRKLTFPGRRRVLSCFRLRDWGMPVSFEGDFGSQYPQKTELVNSVNPLEYSRLCRRKPTRSSSRGRFAPPMSRIASQLARYSTFDVVFRSIGKNEILY